MPTVAPLLYSPQQAAEALGVSRAFVYTLMAKGALHSVKLGGSRKIPVADVRALAGVVPMQEPPDAKRRPAAERADESKQSSGTDASQHTTIVPIATTFAVGDAVRCEKSTHPRGTWSRYAGKTGTVDAVNKRDGEIGVNLGAGRLVWFRPDELVAVEVPRHAPESILESPTAFRGAQ